jgi:bacillithiol biosynthesis cysteine-adding enzyme BshC
MHIENSRHISKLASEYITRYDRSSLPDFFAISPTQWTQQLPALFQSISKKERDSISSKRRDIIDTLRSYHDRLSISSESVEKNLSLLERDNTYAVVTGQQTGIFGGLLFTFYKAVHTIVLSRKYSAQFPDHHFVPVFWQETEDHDLDEAAEFTIVGKDNQLHHLRYSPSYDTARMQVGHIPLEEQPLNTAYQTILDNIQQTDYTNDVLSFYSECYQAGLTFAEAQARFLGKLLAGEGLLLLDANTTALKRHTAQIFETEIQTAPTTAELVNAAGRKLESLGYHSQLDLDGPNLFVVQNKKRQKVTTNDLPSLLKNEPHTFSPNVALRPIIQDTLLPTAAYVAGPGELAYFAQLKDVYKHFNVPMPLIIPRLSCTLIEDKHQKLCKKYSVDLEELLERSDELVSELLRSEQEQKISDRFATALDGLDRSLELVRAVVTTAEPTLDGALTALKGKLLTGVKDFEHKTLAAERKKNAEIKRQFQAALTVLLPRNALQERTLSLMYFLNKYGLQFGRLLIQTLENKTYTEHHLLSVSTIISNE